MAIQVRFATVADAPAIVSICSQAWRATYRGIYSDDYIERVIADFYNLERVRQECQTSDENWHGYIVAELDGVVRACIGGGVQGKVGHVYVLYVEPAFRRNGLGHHLLRGLTAHQRANYQIEEQQVTVTDGNQLGIPFYEKEGFRLLDKVPNWYDASQADNLHYQRAVID